MRRWVMAGGGTGGHLFPGIALAEFAAERGVEVVFSGAERGLEARLLPERGAPFRAFKVVAFRGSGWRGALTASGALLAAASSARRWLHELQPEWVIGLGGYSSAPALLAAAALGLPYVMLEQNAVLGLGTKTFGLRSRRLFLGLPATVPFPLQARARVVGNPLRSDLLAAPPYQPPRSDMQSEVLVLGGSQGARQLNEALPAQLGALGLPLRVRHQAGRGDVPAVQARYAAAGVEAEVFGFSTTPRELYGRPQLVIARAGALTLSEVAALGLPALLVPFPYATSDHQRRNAETFVAAGAAEVLDDKDVPHCAARVAELLKQPEQLRRMSEAMRGCARLDASARIYAFLSGE